MRILVATIVSLALAVAPCAWDTNPQELPAIVTLFAK
jgi:hypothetical protein